MQRLKNIMIAIDQLIWTIITFGKGCPDETMSAAAYRLEQQGKIQGKVFRPVIDFLFFFDNNHCKESYFSEINKKQLPKEYRV